MATLTITKTNNGFSILEKKQTYVFEPYIIDENDTTVDNQTIGNTTVLIGTSSGVILLTTDCSIDNVTYASAAEFITALYA
jgi:hypothetical protein